MNIRNVGIALIAVAIVIAGVTYLVRTDAERTIDVFANETGTCYIDGTCLHGQSNLYSVIGFVVAGLLALLGAYLIVNSIRHKPEDDLKRHKEELTRVVKESKDTDKFEVFLSAFDDQEKLILKAIREQDGILQSTLRFRVGMGKASLSLKLKEFENKGLITREPAGTTNKVFLRKRF